MTSPPVSIVIVSRGRPAALQRCLAGVAQLQYAPFEVVVVADPDGVTAVTALAFGDHVKSVPYDVPNISVARNIGITHAAGDIVAFIDDDAVPEPTWLQHLIGPAAQADVAAMGGYVRGRNGISFQWRAAGLDGFGTATALEIDGVQATVMRPPKGRAIKTEGTNMAFRRDVLIDLGGFDPAYHYFLDETDLNLRLARAGHATALVPLAQVHHGYQANTVRHANRIPRDLFEIGASWAVFHRKHVADEARQTHWNNIRAEQRKRLVQHMITGGLEPRDVRRLMQRLTSGYAEGETRPIASAQLPKHPAAPFKAFPARIRRSVLLPSRPLRFARDMQRAAERVDAGEIVTLLSLSPSAFFHRLYFDQCGVWVQRGGLFGKSGRDQPLFRMTTRSRRLEKERIRVASLRGLGKD